MWCIGRITAEYRERMYDLLGLYAKPYDPTEPVICLDEKSKQLLEQTRRPIAAAPGQVAKEDYEYKRAGTRNLFVAVEPKAGHRADSDESGHLFQSISDTIPGLSDSCRSEATL